MRSLSKCSRIYYSKVTEHLKHMEQIWAEAEELWAREEAVYGTIDKQGGAPCSK